MTRRSTPYLVAVLACASLAVAGCGRDRTEPQTAPAPDTTVSAATTNVSAPRAGVSLSLPRNLMVERPSSGSTVLEAALGNSFVSVFAYRRSEQLPRNTRELNAARRRLLASAERRGVRAATARPLRVDGARAVELLGTQTLDGSPTRVRSLHVFKGSVEYVVEIGAPDADFPRFDGRLRPLVTRSLRLSGRLRG